MPLLVRNTSFVRAYLVSAWRTAAAEGGGSAGDARIASCCGVGLKIEGSVRTDTEEDSSRLRPSKAPKKKVRCLINGPPTVAPNCWRFAGGFTRTAVSFFSLVAK